MIDEKIGATYFRPHLKPLRKPQLNCKQTAITNPYT